MSESVLRVEGLGKAYRQYASMVSRIASWFGAAGGVREETWVLRHLSFNVGRGEAIGIVGQNGAGKSTLLKLLTGVAQPSEGRIATQGRIAAILELGMGFNPELTARDNARHAAGLMGFDAALTEAALPAIEAFAEIGDYFDQPMRTYSSGMQMRVAFSVATAFRPEILIIDEALSVGDAYFQHKSFDRIREFQREGTTLLIVSHDRTAIQALCNRALLLDRGQLLRDGGPEEVLDYYNALIADKENAKLNIEQRRSRDGWMLTRSGTGQARAEDLALVDALTGDDVAVARVGQPLELRLRARINADLPRLVLGFMIRDKHGHVVWGSNTWHTAQVQEDLREGEVVDFRLRFECTLGPGSYSVSPALVSTDTHVTDNFEWTDNLLVFEVVNIDRPLFIGSSWLDARFSVARDVG